MVEEQKNPIDAKNVSFIYKNSQERALDKLNVSLPKGKLILLCGPTGSGKTSFIRSINGLIPHFYHGKFFGYLKIANIDTIKTTPAELSTKVGTVFQTPENQLFAMNVERELTFGLENFGFSKLEIQNRMEYAIRITKIEELLKRAPFSLSSGEQQKVAIASIIALKPEIIILDEPLANLDPQSAQNIVEILSKLKTRKNTILIAEHRLNYILPHIDNLILLNNGKILQFGDPQTILNQNLIFHLGIDISPFFYWLKNKFDKNDFEGRIPYVLDDQAQILLEKFKKNPTNQWEHPIKKNIIDQMQYKDPIIQIKDLSFRYVDNHNSDFVLKNISLNIFPGQIISILGENGAGKSTLIKCLLGLLRPQYGDIYIDNENIKRKPVYEIAKTLGLVFQNPDHQLFADSVKEEFKFSLKNLDISSQKINNLIQTYLKKFDLTKYEDTSPFNLSGGQKRRVSLAAVLIREPEIIIFDEPTVGQDGFQKEKLRKMISQLKKENKTIIIVSHDMDFINQVSERIIIINDGMIFVDGPPSEILNKPNIIQKAHLIMPTIQRITKIIHQSLPEFPQSIHTIDELEVNYSKCQ